MGHSMSNQRKIQPTPLDFDDTRNIVWVYGENNPHKMLASYVTWLPSYNDFNFVSFWKHGNLSPRPKRITTHFPVAKHVKMSFQS